MTINAQIADHIAEKQTYGDAVCQKICQVITKLGFPTTVHLNLPVFTAAEFTLVTDPYTQSKDLVGYWYAENKMRIGQIRFNGDGSFYAEFDIVQPHPSKKQWFVEAINAWGKQDNIKAEAKLLEIPQEAPV
ncbi:hypothetical protein [Methylomonas sp. AM2-LC]|uniref:hypothetical protein n=1 Tax=Methylomonas sp. AM2-LC TaxID=3153301 RepID=UPI003267DF34